MCRSRHSKYRVFSLLLLLSGSAWCKTAATHPDSPVTVLRMDTYMDSFATIYKSSSTIQLSTGTLDLMPSECPAGKNGYIADIYGSTFTLCGSLQDVQSFVFDFSQAVRIRAINDVLDDGVTQFLVYPSTTACPMDSGYLWMLKPSGNQMIKTPCIYAD